MEHDKIIFLDFDGVIIVGYEYRCRRANSEHIERLNRIINATQAKIVVSSSWRIGDDYKGALKQWGCIGEVIGATPCGAEMPSGIYEGWRRGSEIQAWLVSHPTKRFVILDDDRDMGALMPHLLKTEFHTGLQEAHVLRAIQRLNRPLAI